MKQIFDFYKGKRVLVTGGAGFIGSHLVEQLVECGAIVSVFDNFSTGSLNNLRNVLTNVTIFYADICSQHSLAKAIARQDIVFHMAALTSVQESVDNPGLCKKINVTGTHLLLKECVRNDVKRFVFASSCAVYGSRSTPCCEDDTPRPESPYAVSKLEGEKLCAEYAEEYLLPTSMLRYFNVFGPRQADMNQYATVVATFTNNLLTGKPLTIFGNGSQTRDFIHVSDVVMANLAIGTSPSCRGDIFNIGTGSSKNLFQLIEQLEEQLQAKRVAITFQPARRGDVAHSSAQCDKYANFIEQLGVQSLD
ncbi:MAG: NAD-dependent epimerase/dehydratase family protein [Candidatus Babeliales bacterium]